MGLQEFEVPRISIKSKHEVEKVVSPLTAQLCNPPPPSDIAATDFR